MAWALNFACYIVLTICRYFVFRACVCVCVGGGGGGSRGEEVTFKTALSKKKRGYCDTPVRL